AMNLVTRRDAGDEALGGRSSAGRYLFLVPSRNRAIFGTWESGSVAGDDLAPNASDIARFIAELNQAFPSLDLQASDVTLVHRGIVPASDKGGGATPEGHEQIRDGIDGAVIVAGAKYTNARATAERAVDLAMKKLQRTPAPCRTAVTPLPGGDIA